jgi:hypothetical protein
MLALFGDISGKVKAGTGSEVGWRSEDTAVVCV